MAQGAQPSLLDDDGHTAWFLAKTNAFGEIADLLAQHGAKPSLMDATALADRQGVEAVLERFLAEPGLVLQSSTVAVPPQYAVTNQLLSATLEQRIRKALGRL